MPFQPARVVVELHFERRGPDRRALARASSAARPWHGSRHTRRAAPDSSMPPSAGAAGHSSTTPTMPSTTGPAERSRRRACAASTRRNAANRADRHQQHGQYAKHRAHPRPAAPHVLDHQPVLRPAARLERLQPAGCKDGDRRQQFCQRRGGIAVEAEPGALRQPRDLLEGAFRRMRSLPSWKTKTGTPCRPRLPAFSARSSICSSIASPI